METIPQVWSVLTSYNTLADFVPNLDICERVSGAPSGKQRLRQRACSQSLYWRLQAEAILDVQKVVRTRDRRELHFTMVEGDFQVRSGLSRTSSSGFKWLMKGFLRRKKTFCERDA